jgi:IMP dehydrogenase
MSRASAAKKQNVKLIADGGITKSGDIVKALTLADAVICGGLLAGCREAPGEIMEISGKVYKQYRGMGSLAAMKAGSAARYGHDKTDATRKVAAEGIEALKEVSGSVDDVLGTLVGGVQSGMGYLGAANLDQLKTKARYIRVSPAGQKEAAPHDVVEVSTRASSPGASRPKPKIKPHGATAFPLPALAPEFPDVFWHGRRRRRPARPRRHRRGPLERRRRPPR